VPAKRDYYEVLEIDRFADAETIKRAFRKLALKYHPDRNPDSQEAEIKFREVSEAYQILSDPERRTRYDRHGHAAFESASGGFDFSTAGFEDLFGDIFNEFFGGGARSRRKRGEDLSYTLRVTFEEAAFGSDKEITIPRAVPCDDCRGTGGRDGAPPVRCTACRGLGQVRFQQGFFSIAKTCGHCNGRGTVIKDPCATCRGSGRVRKKQTLQVRVPAGVDTGTQLKLRGEGETNAGGTSGDLYVAIAVEEHETFRREGNNVGCDLKIGFPQAALGIEVEVPTLDGPVKLKIKPGTQSGAVIVMRGKGVPDLHGYGRGDQLTRVVVETPRKLTPRQKELLEEFAQISGDEVQTSAKGFFDKVREKFG
jgi:molecular chaperone DnaJ